MTISPSYRKQIAIPYQMIEATSYHTLKIYGHIQTLERVCQSPLSLSQGLSVSYQFIPELNDISQLYPAELSAI